MRLGSFDGSSSPAGSTPRDPGGPITSANAQAPRGSAPCAGIALQFSAEAVLLSTIGGAAGILLGITITAAYAHSRH